MGSAALIVVGWCLLCLWLLRCDSLRDNYATRRKVARKRKAPQAPSPLGRPQPSSRGERRPRVIYSIFAGRKWFMEIHLQYTNELLRRGYVDEVHIWDFCDKGNLTPAWRKVTDANRAYLVAFVNATDRHPGYRYFPPRPRRRPVNGTVTVETYEYAPYYQYYAAAEGAEDDVLIKADDDVVFLDLARFPSFVAMVQGHQRQQQAPVLYFPNILNNDVGLAIQGARLAAEATVDASGAVDASPAQHCGSRAAALRSQYAYYAAKATSAFGDAWTTYYPVNDSVVRAAEAISACPVSSWQCNATSPGTWFDGLFERGDMAYALHRELLVDVEAYVRRCVYLRGRSSASGASRGPRRWSASARPGDATQRLVQLRQRISINFMAMTLATAREVFSLFLREHCCDDEGFVGRWPTLQHRRLQQPQRPPRAQSMGTSDHVVDTAFAVVHYAFAPQYRTAKPLSLHSFVADYRALAARLTPDATPPPASAPANLVTPAAPLAEPVTPNSRASFWTNPRALDPASPLGSAFALLLTRAQVRFMFVSLWGAQWSVVARKRIAAPYSNHCSEAATYIQQLTGQLPEGWSSGPFDRLLSHFRTSNKDEVKKALGSSALLSVVYAAYGLDRLAAVSQAKFEEHVDVWYDRRQREYLAGYVDEDRKSALFRDLDIPPVNASMSPLPAAVARASSAGMADGSGMGDSFKIDRRVVRFTRDPVIVCGPNRRFRLNVRRFRDRVVDLRHLSMHSSPGLPASLQTDAAAIAVATLAHDQPLKPGALE
eukprot:gene16587-11864_t